MPTTAPKEVVRVGSRDVVITNPQKVLFPEAGHTKLDLVRYYLLVADGALRGSGGRPNIMVRFPDGIGSGVFLSEAGAQGPAAMGGGGDHTVSLGRSAEEIVPRDAAALAWMANLACLELHPHPVRAEDLDQPDELRIDLDPVPDVPWSQVREVARVVQATLAAHSLSGWPKTSGKRGMHVSVRIERKWTFDDVRRAALALAREVERQVPAPRPASGGRKKGTASSSTTIRTPKTAPSPAPIRCSRP
jgi:DNA ligase D-like protein (predicted polymerase)